MKYNDFIESESVQTHLEKVATSDANEYIRGIAIRKLKNQSVLKDLAAEDPNPFIRSEAAFGIKNQMILAIIAQKDVHPDVRKSAVSSLKDISILTEISFFDPNDHVRETAVKQLDSTCQDTFAKIALNDKNWIVRHAATWKMMSSIENERVLFEIASTDENEEVRKAASEKIFNENRLCDLILFDKSEKVKLCGILKITNQDLLAKIVKEVKNNKIREIAITKVADQKLLSQIAVTDANRWVREQSVNNLIPTNEIIDILLKVAIEDLDENVRYTAVKKIKNPSNLSKIILECPYNDSVKYAIKELHDLNTLITLRMTAKAKYQNLIVERIKELR